jgi:hypothetical protein
MAAGILSGAVRTWADFYNAKTAVSTAITYLHLTGVLVGGGFAVSADREALRRTRRPGASGRTPAALNQPADLHQWVLAGLALTFVTGFLMLFADLKTYLPSWIFWTKMGLIALLLGNGYLRVLAERLVARGVAAGRVRLRRTSVTSVALWFAVLLFGTMLTNL